MWDGKIGMWAFTEEYTAVRKSKYRAKGATCLRNIPVIDSAIYKEYLLNYLFPTIKATWPRKDRGQIILVQQDNAKPHVSPFDPDILDAGLADGWHIRLTCQPPNSPDLNVLDLGLFASLQTLQYEKKMRGIEDIVDAVEEAFKTMKWETLDNVFLTLQKCMEALLEVEGSNTYAIPHMGKGFVEPVSSRQVSSVISKRMRPRRSCCMMPVAQVLCCSRCEQFFLLLPDVNT